jgi:hypothetical protein
LGRYSRTLRSDCWPQACLAYCLRTQKVILGVGDAGPIKSGFFGKGGDEFLEFIEFSRPADVNEVFLVVAVIRILVLLHGWRLLIDYTKGMIKLSIKY